MYKLLLNVFQRTNKLTNYFDDFSLILKFMADVLKRNPTRFEQMKNHLFFSWKWPTHNKPSICLNAGK